MSRPIILSVPHAGRSYPAALPHLANHAPGRLIGLEDRYADLLVAKAASAGFETLIADMPRVWIDLNRAEDDLDPAMFTTGVASGRPMSIKARGGLGLIPRRTAATGEIWRGKLAPDDLERRLAEVHRPFHEKLSTLLAETRDRFGEAVLLDIHSMPPGEADAPEIVIGDRFGRSAGARIADCAAATLRAPGFRVAINTPYAGGHILERHGAPASGIHALQIEIDRRLYLDPALREPTPQLERIQRLVAMLAERLAAEIDARAMPLAAE